MINDRLSLTIIFKLAVPLCSTPSEIVQSVEVVTLSIEIPVQNETSNASAEPETHSVPLRSRHWMRLAQEGKYPIAKICGIHVRELGWQNNP